jgi:predicted metal-dependent phosphoesterase TrpH
VSVLKVELHAHTADDPLDRIPYSTSALIDRAADLGYDALAITLHDRRLDPAAWTDYAAARGLVLIPGIERTIEGRHVLLINFSARAERVRTFADLARLKTLERGLVIAPHAFFPGPSCLGRAVMDRHADLFDAVEYHGMFATGANFNRAAVRWARRHRVPMVGNGDVHRLQQLGSTYSLVDAQPEAGAICDAIRSGLVTVQANPLAWPTVMALLSELIVMEPLRGLVTTPNSKNGQRPGVQSNRPASDHTPVRGWANVSRW